MRLLDAGDRERYIGLNEATMRPGIQRKVDHGTAVNETLVKCCSLDADTVPYNIQVCSSLENEVSLSTMR